MASFLADFLGGASKQEQADPRAGVDTVEKLCSRVETSTLLEDRRGAVRALKGLAKDYQREVGNRGLDLLVGVLSNDREDSEIARYALETLVSVVSAGDDEADLGAHFTTRFIASADNVHLLMSLLDEYDFYVRYHCIQLLTVLLSHRPEPIQEAILESPQGVGHLVDLLQDSREVVRNEALLLLIQLTRSNESIQSIVAFNEAFTRVLEIIRDEGYADGGIIVQDCLHLMHNLLRDNHRIQDLFRETSGVHFFVPFLQSVVDTTSSNSSGGGASPAWPEQKSKNVMLVLDLIRQLVASGNATSVNNQRSLLQNGLIQLLAQMSMTAATAEVSTIEQQRQSLSVPARIHCQALNAIGDAIYGFEKAQQTLATIRCGLDSSVVFLLKCLLDPRRSMPERLCALYCYHCYLHHNTETQRTVARELGSSGSDAGTRTAMVAPSQGAIIVAALFAVNDPLGNWFASMALAAVLESEGARETALAQTLTLRLGEAPVSVMDHCVAVLLASAGGAGGAVASVRLRVGLLRVLIGWVCVTPRAVHAFVSGRATGVEYLVGAVVDRAKGALERGLCAFLLGLLLADNDNSHPRWSQAKVLETIVQRFGADAFVEHVHALASVDSFVSAASSRKGLLVGGGSTGGGGTAATGEVWLDNAFTLLYRRAVMRIEQALNTDFSARPVPSAPLTLSGATEHATSAAATTGATAATSINSSSSSTGGGVGGGGSAVNAALSEQVRVQEATIAQLRRTIDEQNTLIASLKDQPPLVGSSSVVHEEDSDLRVQFEDQKNELEDLLVCLAETNKKVSVLKGRLRTLGEDVSDDEDDDDDLDL